MNSPFGTQMCGMPLISITLDLDITPKKRKTDVGMRSKKERV
jgi:hypothetical protein